MNCNWTGFGNVFLLREHIKLFRIYFNLEYIMLEYVNNSRSIDLHWNDLHESKEGLNAN